MLRHRVRGDHVIDPRFMPAWLQGNVTFAASAIRERADVPVAWCATAHGGGGAWPSSASGAGAA
jgi:hypothetical protein